jgi:hypothetical protein
VKIVCDKANSRGVEMRFDHVEVPEEVNEVDLSLLPEKERNKILSQRTRRPRTKLRGRPRGPLLKP